MTDQASQIRTRADLDLYIGHFNAKRYEQQIAYYAPDIRRWMRGRPLE